MREIKFRAWDNVQEKILPVEILNFREQYVSLNEGDNSVTDTFEIFELMQYTGLKDKNGKEIYEGDIILCNRNINDMFDKTTFEVKFSAQDGTYAESKRGNTVYAESFDLAEVIGNIYENKELLV